MCFGRKFLWALPASFISVMLEYTHLLWLQGLFPVFLKSCLRKLLDLYCLFSVNSFTTRIRPLNLNLFWIFNSSSLPSYVPTAGLPLTLFTAWSDLCSFLTPCFHKFVWATKHNWYYIFARSPLTLGFPFISRQKFKFLSFVSKTDLIPCVPLLTFLCQCQVLRGPTALEVDLSFSNTVSLAWTNTPICLLFWLSLSFPVLISIDLRFVFIFFKLHSCIFPLWTRPTCFLPAHGTNVTKDRI